MSWVMVVKLWNNTAIQISKSLRGMCVCGCGYVSQEGQSASLSFLTKGASLKINILKSKDRKLHKIKRGCQEVQDVRLFSFPSVFSY